ncbi:hypothetical protein L1987_05541 [Smallanthus sonchifolius]|uniref:Uncharacterized protein n=1 Tax=Smallanthus sonchifolius TaxID=185202 RepID=A0ACB9JVS8_9ASTR|nr:hypothetical protein L1987_05541 [Smallanthus sonchifolius]
MDLLRSIGGGGGLKGEKLDDDDVELSLGLSSNGRFGVERRRRAAANDISGDDNNRLIRSASIADFSNLSSEIDDPTSLTLYPPLTRTCSLPIETEVEWKRRKELQSLRRSEAKRKRVEKLKKENCEVKRRNLMYGNESWRSPPPSLLPPLPRPLTIPAQVGSPASGGSSGVSDLESQPFPGTNKEIELKSTASQQPVSHHITSSFAYRSNSIPSHTTSSLTTNGNLSKDATLKMMFADMPCVSTKGDGVNGKKIEGFLYRYRKGEEVRIVCVCHGSFLTPAEFVKHGGGGDVEHPLRHIVVIPPAI